MLGKMKSRQACMSGTTGTMHRTALQGSIIKCTYTQHVISSEGHVVAKLEGHTPPATVCVIVCDFVCGCVWDCICVWLGMTL